MPVPNPYASLYASMRLREHHGTYEGARTAWYEYGQPDAPTMVFVHGFRGDHHGLEPIVAHLPHMRVLVPDLPGFGESEALADSGIDAYAAWLRAFVAREAPGVPVLGHSFGSIVVAAAAARGLDAERLVLVNPIGSPALDGNHRMLSQFTLGYYRLAARLPESAGSTLLGAFPIVRGMSVLMAKTRDRALRKWIHDQHDQYFSVFANRESLLAAFEASISHNVGEYASQIEQPVLLIAADRDDVTPLADQHRLRPRFADAQLAVLHDVGHLVHYEQPDEAARLIRRFVA